MSSRVSLRLLPGVRVVHRGDGRLQVGFHDGHRVVAPDTPAVRRLLTTLGSGSAAVTTPETDPVVEDLAQAGLLRPPPADLRVCVEHDPPSDPTTDSMAAALGAVGLSPVPGPAPVSVLVTRGSEPRRERTDPLMREDRTHLALTQHSGVTRVGPLVSPGRTACLRCLDAHAADLDPRHAVVLAHHLDPVGVGDAADWQLGVALAVRDLLALAHGRQPQTWSSTVDLVPGRPPVVRRWARHPRCGCAWGDALTG